MPELDATHDARLRSWVDSAKAPGLSDSEPPFGVFAAGRSAFARRRRHRRRRSSTSGVRAARSASQARPLAAAAGRRPDRTLNAFFALGPCAAGACARRLSRALSVDSVATAGSRPSCIVGQHARCPARSIGDYTDFYAGIHHATNVGELFRPDNPLLPNYKWVPIGYHGRARPSDRQRHAGQAPTRPVKAPDAADPSFGPSQRLDYELEARRLDRPWATRSANRSPSTEAADHIAGYCLLNDWSARDIQSWEYQPLGPFLAKNFATTVSPWIVTPDALAPFRVPGAARPPATRRRSHTSTTAQRPGHGRDRHRARGPSRHRHMRAAGDAPLRWCHRSSTRHMYWTFAQMVAHHTSNGCNLHPGDLIGSGTLSAPSTAGLGSLLEITRGGAGPSVCPMARLAPSWRTATKSHCERVPAGTEPPQSGSANVSPLWKQRNKECKR